MTYSYDRFVFTFPKPSMTLSFPSKTLIKSASLNNLVEVTYAPNMF